MAEAKVAHPTTCPCTAPYVLSVYACSMCLALCCPFCCLPTAPVWHVRYASTATAYLRYCAGIVGLAAEYHVRCQAGALA